MAESGRIPMGSRAGIRKTRIWRSRNRQEIMGIEKESLLTVCIMIFQDMRLHSVYSLALNRRESHILVKLVLQGPEEGGNRCPLQSRPGLLHGGKEWGSDWTSHDKYLHFTKTVCFQSPSLFLNFKEFLHFKLHLTFEKQVWNLWDHLYLELFFLFTKCILQWYIIYRGWLNPLMQNCG